MGRVGRGKGRGSRTRSKGGTHPSIPKPNIRFCMPPPLLGRTRPRRWWKESEPHSLCHAHPIELVLIRRRNGWASQERVGTVMELEGRMQWLVHAWGAQVSRSRRNDDKVQRGTICACKNVGFFESPALRSTSRSRFIDVAVLDLVVHGSMAWKLQFLSNRAWNDSYESRAQNRRRDCDCGCLIPFHESWTHHFIKARKPNVHHPNLSPFASPSKKAGNPGGTNPR